MPPKTRKRKTDKDEAVAGGENDTKSKQRKTEKSNEEEVVKKSKKILFEDSARNYWLMKSEPNKRIVNGVDVSFSIEDLMAEDEQTAEWDGVRNHESKNNLKSMKAGDLAFFYHSNCRTPGVAGIVEIVRSAYPDESQFNPESPYYDPDSFKEEPKWFSVDVKFVRMFNSIISFAVLKKHKSRLPAIPLFSKLRLSVQPLTKQNFDYILQLDLDQQQLQQSAVET